MSPEDRISQSSLQFVPCVGFGQLNTDNSDVGYIQALPTQLSSVLPSTIHAPLSVSYLQLDGTGSGLSGWHDAGSRQRVSEFVTAEQRGFQSGISILTIGPLILTMFRHCDNSPLVQHLAHRDP